MLSSGETKDLNKDNLKVYYLISVDFKSSLIVKPHTVH